MKTYLATRGETGEPTSDELDAIVERYEWFTPARILRSRLTGKEDGRLQLIAAGRGISPSAPLTVDAAALVRLTDEDLIDRFLRATDLKIVAETGEPEGEIATEAALDEEDDVVSEELAEVYLAQGLRAEALSIYRRLSLLNPEKSVYFAEIIRKMETNN